MAGWCRIATPDTGSGAYPKLRMSRKIVESDWQAGRGEEIYEVIEVDGYGDITVTVQCNTPGDLLVTVSGASLNAAMASITITRWIA
jgi:hypothetical protein